MRASVSAARRFAALALAVLAAAPLALAAAGCGGQGSSTPAACLEGAPAYEKALAAAPGEVLLGGEIPISDCLSENQSGGDLSQVGEAMVAAATQLNAAARQDPGGDAALQLGYLLGAAQRGAERTEGIHSDLVRRLTAAARYAPGTQPLPPAFFRAYRTGYAAGQRDD
ncbi:MAG TPA: hypothetical protein VNB59_05225 [Solirubrobacterales bacterium]|jgi:hypothetical protein|nr:hypothetical protein [Solirubrobacterales bacterium]